MSEELVKQRRKYAAHLRDVGYEPIADAFVEDADRIEALTSENERLAEAGAKQAFEVGVLREALDWMSNSEPLVVEAILSRVSAALGDTQ